MRIVLLAKMSIRPKPLKVMKWDDVFWAKGGTMLWVQMQIDGDDCDVGIW
jgi:hypothetical protein